MAVMALAQAQTLVNACTKACVLAKQLYSPIDIV